MKIDFSAEVKDMNPIQTRYKGFWFRSRLEARWAVFFDSLDLSWSYEVQGFRLSNSLNYLPDFFIMDVETSWGNHHSGWVEVKGVMKKKDEEKCRELAIQSEMPVVMVQGDPLDYYAEIYRKYTPTQRVYISISDNGVMSIQKKKPEEKEVIQQAARKARSERFEG